MKLMRVKPFSINNDGYYTVEGAFAITTFVALFLMFISIIRIMIFELTVQRALDKTAMSISQFAYYSENVNQLSTKLASSELAGAALCETLFVNNLEVDNASEWLEGHGVKNGILGLNFLDSEIDFQSAKINAAVSYNLEVNAFGVVKKSILITQQAHTSLWNPNGNRNMWSAENTSIWQMKPTERGKIFVERIKKSFGGEAVASGQGIDLYFRDQNALAEIHSLNIYDKTYSNDGAVNLDNLSKLLNQYAVEMQINVDRSKKVLDMEDGSVATFPQDVEKRLIIVMPKEAENNALYKDAINNISGQIKTDMDIKIVVEYLEEAFPNGS